MDKSPATAGDYSPEEATGALDRMLSLAEVCAVEGVSRWTVRRCIRNGTFPAGLDLENGREGWPESWMKERRKNKLRRTSGATVEAAA